jgi:hypothetical protein
MRRTTLAREAHGIVLLRPDRGGRLQMLILPDISAPEAGDILKGMT